MTCGLLRCSSFVFVSFPNAGFYSVFTVSSDIPSPPSLEHAEDKRQGAMSLLGPELFCSSGLQPTAYVFL